MKKFIEDLRQELSKRNMKTSDIDDIIADHEEMIETAKVEGLTEDEMRKRFGDPVKLADELSDFSAKDSDEEELTDDFQIWKSFSVTSNGIDVDVHLVSEDITFKPSLNGEIKVYQSGIKDLDKYDLDFTGKKLTLKAPKYQVGLFMRRHSEDQAFIVELPKTLILETFSYNSVSSDFKFSNLNVEEFTLNTTSGDLEIKHANLGKTKWNTVSGDILVNDSKVKVLTSSQVSGDMTIQNVFVLENMSLNTVSGDAKIDHVICNQCSVHSVSGDIDGLEFYPESVSLKSVSGDVTIKNKEAKTIKIISKSTVSGDIDIHS